MNMPPIPEFLLREKIQDVSVMPIDKPVIYEDKKITFRLTRNLKSKLALEIIQYVRANYNTFGKVRKAISASSDFSRITDREIRAGLRYAMTNRIPVPKVIGRGKSRQTTVRYYTMAVKGRTYSAVEV